MDIQSAQPVETVDIHAELVDRRNDIEIEQRNRDEVGRSALGETVPADAQVYNPAFDVTPAALITAIISDRGIHHPPYSFTSSPATPTLR